MLQNAYFLAKIGADTAENERNVAEILPKNSQNFAIYAQRSGEQLRVAASRTLRTERPLPLSRGATQPSFSTASAYAVRG